MEWNTEGSMRRRLSGTVLALGLVASGCHHGRTTAQAPPRPTVALAAESLIPRSPDQRPPSTPARDAGQSRLPAGAAEPVETLPARNARQDVSDSVRQVAPASLETEALARRAVAAVGISDAAPPAPAAEPSAMQGAAAGMTLAELEALALVSNPSIHQASAVARKAVGTRLQVGLCPNPTVAYMGEEMGDNGTYGQQGVQVSQTFVSGNKLEWNQRVADQEVQAMSWQVQAQRQRVLTDVRRAFYEALGAQQRVQLTTELESIASEAADKARLLVENLQGARPDQLQAETQFSEIAILRRQAEFEFAAAAQRLANLAGRPRMAIPRLEGELESGVPERDWDVSLQHVLSNNPTLMRAYAEAQRARVAIERAGVQPIPNVQVQAGIMHMAESDNVGANLQLGLPLPLFNRNQGNIDRAWSEYHRAQWNAERLRLSLESRLAEAFGAYRDAANRVATYRDEIVPRQAETLELVAAGYPTQFDYLRLFTARRAYYDARIQHLNALVDLRQAEALIDGLLLTGGLGEVDDTMLTDDLRDSALGGQ